jgi:hypothetical protein
MVERVHKTINNYLRTLQMHLLMSFMTSLTDIYPLSRKQSILQFTTLTPTQQVFRRDAFLPVAFEADWNYIAERKQRLIVQNNKRETPSGALTPTVSMTKS